MREQYWDPAFEPKGDAVKEIVAVAWDAYKDYRKNPRTRPAGRAFAKPDVPLPVEWLETRRLIRQAAAKWKKSTTPSRILLINASPRSDQTCPGEMSKTFRLLQVARRVIEKARGFEVDILDLSRIASEYGRHIHPCKGCVSTAMPLCHWPCSCYPNHAMGQVNDWMAEIYVQWVAAHGVMIVTPVHWYSPPSVLKLMMDRLVCTDGGNPDPTTTGGKDPMMAKAIELRGWDYPRHLADRVFSVVVHGDAAGVDPVRRGLTDWLLDLELIPAGADATPGRYIGYYGPYATSHTALDADRAFQEEVRNAARSLVATVREVRAGRYRRPERTHREPRPK